MIDDLQRPKLPTDTGGRSWVLALPDDGGAAILKRAVVCTLVAADDDLQFHVLGTAFVVGASGDRALCMCAAHSLEQAKAIEDARRPRSAWNSPPDLFRPVPRYVSPDRIKAFFNIAGAPVTCDVDQLNYQEGNDVAVITIVSREDPNLFQHSFPLSFDVPLAGAEVAVLSNQLTLTPRDCQETEINLSVQMRHGTVTEIEFGKTMREQSSVFYTTIPVTGGMSGSPVFTLPEPNAPIIVCGMVSSDFSVEESFRNFLVPGRSAISMLWPSCGLGVNVRNSASERLDHHTIYDLARVGFIDDRTSAARIDMIHSDREWTEISYEDVVHGRIVLQTTRHPNSLD